MAIRRHPPRVVVEWVALLLRAQDVPDSNIGPEGSSVDTSRGFRQSLQENSGL
jgi:hypothetical protein